MSIAKGKTTKSFRSCENKGFHLKFKNGWIVSVQFGYCNYSENYDLDYKDEKLGINNILDFHNKKPDLESDTAELWAWSENGKNYPNGRPLGYQNIEQLLKFIEKVRRFKRGKKK